MDLSDIARQAVAKATELVKVQEPQRVLTQAEIEAELAIVMVENAQSQRDAQWRSLAVMLGRPDMASQTVTGTLSADTPSLVWEEAMTRIRSESPELAAAASRVEELRWKVHRACAEATPNVTMQAGVYYDDASSDPFATFQLSLPLPIYNRNQGGIAEARANVNAATNAARRVELRLQNQLSTVFQQYEQAHQQASRYESSILAKTERNLDLSKQSYDIGQSSYLAVLTAQRSYTEAHLTWLNALERLWTATVQIDGLLLGDNLTK
jgi:cobalt-zinc-cadmium efflux system outer membrane protein